MFSHSIIAAAAIFLSTANAHMFINSPSPIQGTSPKDPLFDDGSNFPCHGAQFITGKGGANMAVGSSQALSFELGGPDGPNWAVHGGGSCQISLTYETDPVKVKDPSNWKVLYSIMGGCPTNFDKNLDGSHTGPQGTYQGAIPCSDPRSDGIRCVNTFNFTIPKEVKNGAATLGFTWFNSVGNREMYMNCADVTITGGTDKGSLSSLPNMHVANIAAGGLTKGSDCSTSEKQYPVFPNPGQYVLTKTLAGAVKAAATGVELFPLMPFSGAGCAKAAAAQPTAAPASPTTYTPAQATGGSNAGSGSQTGGFIGNSPAASSTKGSKGGNPGGVFAPGAASATTFVPAVATNQPAAAAPSAPAAQPQTPAAQPQAPSNGSSSGSSSCTNGATSCPTDGIIVCLPNNKWGLCDHGCAVPMLMAAGMMCENGAMKAAVRRQVRHPHGLAHRRSLI